MKIIDNNSRTIKNNLLLKNLIEALANCDETSIDVLIGKGIDKDKALVVAAKRVYLSAVDLLISKGADMNTALAILAKNSYEASIDLLIGKGANKNKALVIAAKHGDLYAVNFLRSKGADMNTALAIALLNGDEDTANFMINIEADKAYALEMIDVSLTILFMRNREAYESKNDKASILSSKGDDDHEPEGDFDGSIIVGVKRTRLIDEEDQEEAFINSSSSSPNEVSPSKIARTGNSVNVGSKKANLDKESNSIENHHDDNVQQDNKEETKKELSYSKVSSILKLKTKLDNVTVYKNIEEQDLEDAEKEIESVTSDEVQQGTIKSLDSSREDLVDHQYLPESMDEKQVRICEKVEISMLYQLGEWVYDFIENSLSSHLVFTDKSGVGIFPLSYDIGLPKLDVDSTLFGNMHEVI